MNKRCFFLGHDIDSECLEFNCIQYCKRCGEDDHSYLSETIPSKWRHFTSLTRYGWRLVIRQWFREKTRWFRKCDDCGKRFGRHDDSIDHIPF